MNLNKELLDIIEQASTSVGQELDEPRNWTEWDSILGPKHESVLLDHGGRYGFTNNIIHITDRAGNLWQVVEDYSSGGKYGEYIFYKFVGNEKGITERYGPMRYSTFLELFSND